MMLWAMHTIILLWEKQLCCGVNVSRVVYEKSNMHKGTNVDTVCLRTTCIEMPLKARYNVITLGLRIL